MSYTLAKGTSEGFRRTYKTTSNSSGINLAERDLRDLCTAEDGLWALGEVDTCTRHGVLLLCS